jgi:hypothetical protein
MQTLRLTRLDLQCPSFAMLDALFDFRKHSNALSSCYTTFSRYAMVDPAVDLQPTSRRARVDHYPETAVPLPVAVDWRSTRR